MSTFQSYSTFWVGDFYFGILTADVVELTKGLEVTAVPLGPREVAGLINLRGQIVTGIDARIRLGMPAVLPDENSISIFFRNQGTLYGLLVDGVSDILELDGSTFEDAPINLPVAARDLIIGVQKLSNRLLLILDPNKIISGINLNPR